ncbi:hypothetical protein SprV_1002909600 [Sparganum proliferum]
MMRGLHGGMKARIPDNGTCQEYKCNELPQRLDSLPFANAAAAAADENGSMENSLGHNPVEGAGRPRSRTRHLQPALREGPPAKSLHRTPLR